MSSYPIVFKTSNGAVLFKVNNGAVVFKDKTLTLDTQSENPKVMLQWSDDGGFTWSNEYWKAVGRIGEYKASVDFTRLGMSRDRVFRMTVTDPVKWIIIGARMDVEKEQA
jgi:Neuraminidase (sialidase)